MTDIPAPTPAPEPVTVHVDRSGNGTLHLAGAGPERVAGIQAPPGVTVHADPGRTPTDIILRVTGAPADTDVPVTLTWTPQ